MLEREVIDIETSDEDTATSSPLNNMDVDDEDAVATDLVTSSLTHTSFNPWNEHRQFKLNKLQ